MTRTLSIIWAAVLILPFIARVESAPLFLFIDGKLIDTMPAPPINPSSEWECVNFAESTTKTLELIDTAHSLCLDQNEGVADKASGEVECSIEACNDLHVAKSRLAKKISEDRAACVNQLKERAVSVGRSILIRVFEDVEDDVKEEMKSIAFADTTGSDHKDSEGISEDDEDSEGQEGITLDDAEIIRIDGIISKCDGLSTLEQQKLCMSEVHGWAEKNLSVQSMNIVSELIQSSSMSELENVTSLVLEKVDKIDHEIESIGDDKEGVF